MHLGRNEPCHCGSGRKYKHCCAQKDRAAAASSPARTAGRSRHITSLGSFPSDIPQSADWEIELAPIAIAVESEPGDRPAALVIAANGYIVDAELVGKPPSEPEEIGMLLAERVVKAARELGWAPRTIHVRLPEIAQAVRAGVAALGSEVRCERSLPEVEQALAWLRQKMLGTDEPVPAVSLPQTWAGWGLPDEMIREIFGAAAAYYLAQPWSYFGDEVLLSILLDGPGHWFASVMGAAGQSFGLLLFDDADEMERLVSRDDAGLTASRSPILSISFVAKAELPKPMRREIAEAKWPIAGPSAYPVLYTVNTPGGGLRRKWASELARALRGVAGYAVELERARAQGGPLPGEWRGDDGTVVRYQGDLSPDAAIWELPRSLATSLGEGPGVQPRAIVNELEGETGPELERPLEQRFAAWLRARGGPPSRIQRDESNVNLFLAILAGDHGLRVAAITEFDLRVLLYDTFIRKVRVSRNMAGTMRGSLRRFFEFLAECEGIVCPWAARVLRDKEAFELRFDSFPGGFWWDPEVALWQSVLYADLQARAMTPSILLEDRDPAPDGMGVNEHRVWRLLQREWLIWRDELIRGGITSPSEVLDALHQRQRFWESQRLPEFGDRRVRDVVGEERERRAATGGPPLQ